MDILKNLRGAPNWYILAPQIMSDIITTKNVENIYLGIKEYHACRCSSDFCFINGHGTFLGHKVYIVNDDYHFGLSIKEE